MESHNPKADAYLTRGIVAYEARHLDEAAELFGKAIAVDSESAQAHLALGATRLTHT